ncbi:TonB-dependent receptor [Rariglobus hedericola]|uniref:TonB-dependent receptor n=1 Tax=Rariglobus hedericola TaxID=2597822 RepID=A0A556QR48_9BACT|nr:TonB-dependent receptor [Rariglobus hedericola]TSJ79114.1 hypothetical protein FPL22_07425 [Rariglobus hedericola]
MSVRPFLRLLPAALVAFTALHADEPVVLDPVEVTGSVPGYLRLDSPTTVTSHTGSFLKTTGVSTYADLAPLVPGLFISEQSVANSSLYLRGIGTDNGDPRTTQRVAVFQDNVLLANNAGLNVALFDLDRVDILKGPQPAVFGRGTQIGAVSFVTNKARNETSTELTAGVGSFNARTVSGYTNLPVITDKLFVRAAFTIDQADGYVDNLADGSDLQGRDTVAFRGSLRWQPSAETTADLIVNVQHDTPPGIAFKSMSPLLSDGNPYTAANLNRGRALGADRTVFGLTGIISHQLNEAWTLTSTTGWRDVDAAEEFDADGSPLFLLEAGEYTQAHQFSHDVRLSYDADERFKSSIGAGVFWQKASQRLPLSSDLNQLFQALAGVAPPFPLPTNYQEEFTNYGESKAADLFGDASYKLTSKFTVGASLRLTHEKLTSGYESINTPTPTLFPLPILPTAGGGNSLFAPTTLRQTSESYNSWTGALNGSYEITKQHTAYASVGKGRRPPSLTYSQDPAFNLIELKEEVVWNYEAGLKGTLANQRIAYDVAVFQYYYSNFQTQNSLAPPPAPTVATDGGRARGQGFETSLQGTVNDHLTLFGSYGFTDAQFSALDEDGQPQTYAGNSFRLTSRHVIALGGTVSLPVDAVGTFFVTPSWEYKSEHFFEDNNQKSGGTLRQGGFGLMNLRVGYRTPDNRWEVVLWARNLLDHDYLIDAGNIAADFGFPTSVRGAPRTLGLNITARF